MGSGGEGCPEEKEEKPGVRFSDSESAGEGNITLNFSPRQFELEDSDFSRGAETSGCYV